MLISTAYAQTAPAPAGGGGFDLLSMAPLVLIFVVFYFLLIRPQQKKVKDHRALVANLRRGDRVVTGGGIIGLVTKVVSDTEIQVEISDGVRVRVLRGSVTEVLKTGPAEGKEVAEPEPAEPEKKGR